MDTDAFIGTPLAKEIAYIVEANSYERSQLWKDYKYETVTLGGRAIYLGHVDESPVYMSLTVVKVEGKYVLFYEPTSMIVSYYLVDEWLNTNYPQCHKAGERRLHSDAQNFHNVVAHCKHIGE